MLLSPDRLHAIAAIMLIWIFWIIIIPNQLMHETVKEFGNALFASIMIMPFLVPFLLLIGPAKAVSRRLLFLALGLILLIALNQLSKLGLDVTAPKLQG